MIKNCIMSGAETFLFIFLALLVLAAVILTIYFVFRHDNKKNNPPTSNGGNTNKGGGGTTNTGLTNLLPPGSGATGPVNLLVPGFFSISPEMNSSAYMSFQAPISPGSTLSLPIIVPEDTSINCSKYAWQNVSNNNFTSGLISNSRDIGGLTFPANLNSENQANVRAFLGNNTTANANWSYNPVNKTWCSLENPNTCLFYQAPNPVSPNGAVFLNALPAGDIPDNFKWNNVPSIAAPNCF